MIIVTGGAGFIGSNIVKALNKKGHHQIIVVDDLEDGHKYRNLLGCTIDDYIDKDDFLEQIKDGFDFGNIEAIFHQGACSSTTEWDGRYMMKNNYEYSKALLSFCQIKKIPFLYASSAAIYGDSSHFIESAEYESPLNVYGYSKFLFDNWARKTLPNATAQIVGFRYFNVYGPGENHKGSMASVAFHFNNQISETGKCQLFEGSDGYSNGDQRRDFIYVEDVAKVNLWFFDNPNKSGIYNVGTGRSQTFNDIANAVIKWHNNGVINYIPLPDHLKGAYQSFTEANISALRETGYKESFNTVEQGVKKYLDILNVYKTSHD